MGFYEKALLVGAIVLLFVAGVLIVNAVSTDNVDHAALQAQCLTQFNLSDYQVIGGPVVISQGTYAVGYTWLVSVGNGSTKGETMYYDRGGNCVFQGSK